MAESLSPYIQNGRHLLTSRWFTITFGSVIAASLARFLLRSTTTKPPPDAPTSPPNQTQKCRYRLDNGTSDTFLLPDGRKLGYAQYGSPSGRAILYQHGLPGSRIEASSYHDLCVELGARIIAVDRPGYGWSSPHPGRTILGWPKDLECLAEHLGLEEYSVLGVSGGGPYALSCAASLSHEKLKCVSIICGLGPPDIGMAGAGIMHRIAFPTGWRYAPVSLVRWNLSRDPAFNLSISDTERLKLWQHPTRLSKITHPRELEVMQDTDYLQLSLQGMREALAQGWEWICQDGALMCMNWGFRIEDVRKDLPVQLWHGKDDTFVPVNHAVQIAKRLGDRAELRVEQDTHGSISHRWKREVLSAILAKM